MRAGAAAGHDGYHHEAAIYASDEELVRLVVPHVDAGVAAGEPTFIALPDHEAALVRAALAHPTRVTFLPAPSSRARPPVAIKSLRAWVAQLVDQGAGQVRAVNSVPHPGSGSRWEGWCRYEAAVNDLLADLPVWGLCVYDRRCTSAQVLDDVERTHPYLSTGDGRHLRNPRFEEPIAFLRSRPPPPPDPMEALPPNVELTRPAPATGRRVVRDLARKNDVAGDALEGMVLATSEAITNALMHGRGQVTMRAWATRGTLVVAVSDEGDGPEDPYVGLVPRSLALDDEGGVGLWLSHQLVDVSYARGGPGFTVRLMIDDDRRATT